MSEKVGPVGGNMGGPFDDGVFDGVKKIIVGKDSDCVSYIKIEYEKDGNFETREYGTIRGEQKEFAVDYPNEYITSVGGGYEHVCNYGTVLIKSLIFKTSYGRTSPILGHSTLFGNPAGKEFLLEGKNGGKLIGFHGRYGQALDAIGSYFFAVNSPFKNFKLQGGMGGYAWDDGVFDGVKKITVGEDRGMDCVTYIKTEYGDFETREHGIIRRELQEFAVDYPSEYITSVGGSYNYVFNYRTELITSLTFKTSYGRTSPTYGKVVGTKFVFEDKGLKLVGFFGRSGDALDALSAHFALATEKIGPIGGNKGVAFEDGVFEGVKKITVGSDIYSVTYIKIEYEKDGTVKTREHGTNSGELKEFVVDYPNEYITAVGGSYNHIFNYDTTLITSLFFTLNNGRTSPKFGETAGTDFMLQGKNGAKLLGFFGRGGQAIDAIGAYFEIGSGGSQSDGSN